MSTFLEYLSEAQIKVLSHTKKKSGSRLQHTAEVASKKKLGVDDVAIAVGYPPIAYGISNVKITDLGDGKWKYEFQTAQSAD